MTLNTQRDLLITSLIAISIILVFLTGFTLGKKVEQHNAVKAKVGVFQINTKTGETQFVYKTTNE